MIGRWPALRRTVGASSTTGIADLVARLQPSRECLRADSLIATASAQQRFRFELMLSSWGLAVQAK